MSEFPKINEKFYNAGLRLPTLRAAFEAATAVDGDSPRQDHGAAAWEERESKKFSLFLGFADGVIGRLRR